MFTFRNIVDEKLFNSNDLIKFKNIWKPNDGSKIWILECHILYTNSECTSLFSCDYKTYTKSISLEYDGQSPILDLNYIKQNNSLNVYIITHLGDVNVYSYSNVTFNWTYVGHFILGNQLLKESSKENGIILSSVCINNDSIFWCEKHLDMPENANYFCCMRTLPPPEVLDITNIMPGPVKTLLSNCPRINLHNVGNYLFIIPILPISSGLFLVWFRQCGLKVCDIESKCLWSNLNFNLTLPINFLLLIRKVVGLWTKYNLQPIYCHMLSKDERRIAFLLEDFTLALFDATNNHIEKIEINNSLNFEDIKSCYIFNYMLFIFDVDATLLHIHSLKDGELVEVMCLEDLQPLVGVRHMVAQIPLLAIYNDNAVYRITYNSLQSILSSDSMSLRQIKQCFNNEQLQLLMLLNEIKNELKPSDTLPLTDRLLSSLQSEALLLAIGQTCRDKSLPVEDAFTRDDWNKLCSGISTPNTKLHQLLQPFVDGFIHLEKLQSNLFAE